MWSTVATQSRIASLMASLRVREPDSTETTSAPSRCIRATLSAWRSGVDLAHVDHAVQAEVRRRGGRGDAVLAGPGLGDHPGLAHPLGEQRLAEHVADLVGAGVVEVLALEQDPGAGELGQLGGVVEQARRAGVLAEQPLELAGERRVGHRVLPGDGELVERRHQRLGHHPPAEAAESARLVVRVRVGGGADGVDIGRVLRVSLVALLQGRVRPGGDEVGDRGPRVLALDQGLPDEDDVGALLGVLEHVVRPADPGLGDPDDVVGDPRGEPGEGVAVDLERLEVAGVDADERWRRRRARGRPPPRRGPRRAG